MNNLAVVIVTCEKSEWIWDLWHYYFRKHWKIPCPVYFISDKASRYPGIQQITIDVKGIDNWTRLLREGIEYIPEKNLFILLEDVIFNYSIDAAFLKLYSVFKYMGADAMRIRKADDTIAILNPTERIMDGRKVKKLAWYSKYLISFSPNIWDRDYLKKCITKDESPWSCEVKGSRRVIRRFPLVMDYVLYDWHTHAVKGGELTEAGQLKLNDYETTLQQVEVLK